jgi:hypothetical protein
LRLQQANHQLLLSRFACICCSAVLENPQGFLDFVLNGNVVDLAVGVVVGMAFTLLMQAFTEDFLTPALGAVFAGEGARGCEHGCKQPAAASRRRSW